MTHADSQEHAHVTHICCIGAGYVGGPTCAVISAKCPEISVTVVDKDSQKIAAWNSRKLPVYEPGLDKLIKRQLNRNLLFSTDIKGAICNAQIVIVAVDTPSMPAVEPGPDRNQGLKTDLQAVEQCMQMIAKVSLDNKIVVSKSTVPCGTSSRMQDILDKNAQPGVKFSILSNPEFLRQGSAIQDLLFPDRIIIGSCPLDTLGKWAQGKLKWIYQHWVPEHKILTMDRWSSELVKLSSNAMLAQRISSINAISATCEAVGADITQVTAGCSADSRIGSQFLHASLGFGGSCFQKDLASLVWLCESLGLPEVAAYWHQVLVINWFQTKRFVSRIIDTFAASDGSGIRGKQLACLGFAFKQGTGDTRNSPADDVCQELLGCGALLSIFDPRASKQHIWEKLSTACPASNMSNSSKRCNWDHSVQIHDNPYSAIAGSKAVVVLTAWPEFQELDWELVHRIMKDPFYIFDGHVLLDHSNLHQLGFQVVSVGKKKKQYNG